ncbi:ATP synthase subunit I [Neisseria leonii]|uniref:ATP synthase subunit I n=1 Tax=Neisseria leonii TaxID=2995413 RepID=A0A9X4IB82_9NEIS|nr:ATP synthase subunit I [Neisseria sp. 51.81]MDD9328134.1 ATP synthase subunit I [Neisseria sp. 51.81]
MFKILSLQAVVLSVAAAFAWLVSGGTAAVWAAVGGLCYLLPSAATVLVLKLFRNYPQYAGYAFIFGEGLRIVLALAMMVALFALYRRQIHFPAFLAGLLAVSHVVFLVFWKVKRYGK